MLLSCQMLENSGTKSLDISQLTDDSFTPNDIQTFLDPVTSNILSGKEYFDL